MENKIKSYISTLNEIDREYEQKHGEIVKIPMNKVDYITMIEVEKAIIKMDRLFNRVDKVNYKNIFKFYNKNIFKKINYF